MKKHPNDERKSLRTMTAPGTRGNVRVPADAADELIRVKAALERQTRELEDFFENASVGIHWVSPGGTILRANRAELELLGYAKEEYLGRNIADFYVDRQVFDDFLGRLRTGDELREYEAGIRCRDGSVKQVMINSNALWEDGELVHVRAITRDITDRKQVEEARGRLAAIVESSHDAIVSKTLDGRIVSWNPEAERLFVSKPLRCRSSCPA